jgi:hypothetical protein
MNELRITSHLFYPPFLRSHVLTFLLITSSFSPFSRSNIPTYHFFPLTLTLTLPAVKNVTGTRPLRPPLISIKRMLNGLIKYVKEGIK